MNTYNKILVKKKETYMDHIIICLILGIIIEYLADGTNGPDEPTTLIYDIHHPIRAKVKLKSHQKL